MQVKNKIKMLKLQVKTDSGLVILVCIELFVEDVLLTILVHLINEDETDKKVLSESSNVHVG